MLKENTIPDAELESLRHRFDAAVKKAVTRSVSRNVHRQIDQRVHYALTEDPYCGRDRQEDDWELLPDLYDEFCLYDRKVTVHNEAIAEAILELANRRREIILLELLNLTNKQIGQLMEIKERTVRTEKSLAKSELRRRIRNENIS